MTDKSITASCPFCALDPIEGDIETGANERGDWFVYCVGCFSQGPARQTEEEAVQAWNERTVFWKGVDEEVRDSEDLHDGC